jgi:hypothetical protein
VDGVTLIGKCLTNPSRFSHQIEVNALGLISTLAKITSARGGLLNRFF